MSIKVGRISLIAFLLFTFDSMLCIFSADGCTRKCELESVN